MGRGNTVFVRRSEDLYTWTAAGEVFDALPDHIVVGRAGGVTGPYCDRDGTPMLEGGGTLVLRG